MRSSLRCRVPVVRFFLAALGGLLLLTSVSPVATAAAPGDSSDPPPITFTFSKPAGEPRYGDEFVLGVTASYSGLGNITVKYNNVVVAEHQGRGTATLRIPTLDRFPAGTTYQLDVLATSDVSTGEGSVRFTPTKVTGSIIPASLTVAHRAPVYAQYTTDAPTAALPTGRVEIAFPGRTLGGDIRTDGTVQMGGDWPEVADFWPVTITYQGNTNFAPAVWEGRITVRPTPTLVEASLSSPSITQGQALYLEARTVSPDPGVFDVPVGNLYVEAQRSGTQTWETLVDPQSSRGFGWVTFDLQSAFVDRPGTWALRVRYGGNPQADPAEKTVALEVKPPEAPKTGTVTTVKLDRSTAVIGGAPVTVTVKVVGADGTVPSGIAQVSVGGAPAQRVTLDQHGEGTLTTVMTQVRGDLPIVAAYEGSSAYLPSDATAYIDSHRASTAVTVLPSAGTVTRGQVIDVRVAATNSTVTPGSSFTVWEGNTQIDAATIVDGAYRLPDLALGEHTLTFTYEGEAFRTAPSEKTVTLVVVPRDPDGRPAKSATTTSVVVEPERVAVGGSSTVTATVAAADGTAPTGQVSFLLDGTVFATQQVTSGRTAAVRLPASATSRAGSHQVTARYLGTDTQAASDSASRTLTVIPGVVGKAAAKLTVKAKATKARTVKVTASLAAAAPVAGQVKVYRSLRKGKKTKLRLVAVGTVTKAGTKVALVMKTKRFEPGRHTLTVKYGGSTTVLGATKSVKVTIR